MAAKTTLSTIDTISTPIADTNRQLMSGDEAVAWAALDSDIRYASSYPGTPTTNIQETLEMFAMRERTRVVWSINEKVAYESALAAAIGGQRALVSMKQVGLNVASDAFINSCPSGVNGGLVLVIGDDAECHSSPHKQDSRMYRAIAGVLLLEPADAQEAYSMTRQAFHLSERFLIPVMVRLTMRTAYGSTPVLREPAETSTVNYKWPKEPARFFAIPTLSRRLFQRLYSIQSDLQAAVAQSPFTICRYSTETKDRLGIVCTGVGYAFAMEHGIESTGVLKVGGEPFPVELIREFICAHTHVAVLEEGDPILESLAIALAPRQVAIRGRMSGDLKPIGELQAPEVIKLLTGCWVKPEKRFDFELPPRMPEICKPCGYNKVYGALKQIQNLATPSDIGCNTLGGLPPYSVMDGVWAMGSSIGVACGLAAMGHPRVLAIIGDSTFFHAGIPPLIEAVHERYTLTVLLLDNGAAAMTGGQSVPHRAVGSIQQSIDLIGLIQAIGADCTPFDPHKLGQDGIRDLVEDSFLKAGVKVLLYRSQCGIYSPGYFTEAPYALKKKEDDE